MALKDESLDEKIREAARAEFLEHGYRDASVHIIARKAGATSSTVRYALPRLPPRKLSGGTP